MSSLPKPYYERDGITIYHGDCREILPELGRASLVLTDPPYGLGEAAGKNTSRGHLAAARDYGSASWDDTTVAADLMRSVVAAGKHAIVFGGNYYAMPPSSCWLVWDKDNGGNDFADCELAWTNLRKAVRLLKWRWNGMLQEHGGSHKEHRWHPTQKPVAVMRWCLSHVEDASLVLDPFMGSGTTLVAAKLEGRRAIGIELEERYCEIAAKRLAQGVFDFSAKGVSP